MLRKRLVPVLSVVVLFESGLYLGTPVLGRCLGYTNPDQTSRSCSKLLPV